MCVNYYDWVKIQSLSQHCKNSSDRLWLKGLTTWESGDDLDKSSPIIDECPPISLCDIAQFQVALFTAMDETMCESQFIGAFSLVWKSDQRDFIHHIVRFSMEKGYTGMMRPNKQERIEEQNEVKERRNNVATFFSQIESAHIAHYMGWLSVPPETVLYNVPNCLRHISESDKLPSDYGTLIMTLVGAFEEDLYDDSMTMKALKKIMSNHIGAYIQTIPCEPA